MREFDEFYKISVEGKPGSGDTFHFGKAALFDVDGKMLQRVNCCRVERSDRSKFVAGKLGDKKLILDTGSLVDTKSQDFAISISRNMAIHQGLLSGFSTLRLT